MLATVLESGSASAPSGRSSRNLLCISAARAEVGALLLHVKDGSNYLLHLATATGSLLFVPIGAHQPGVKNNKSV